MTESRTLGHELQDEILSTVRKSQAAVVEGIQTWASAVQSITPAMPELNVPFAGQLPRLPKPQELIASAYDFAEQLLASQRKFAEDVIEATAPLTAGSNDAPARKNGAAAK
jgi:hypothetical protein